MWMTAHFVELSQRLIILGMSIPEVERFGFGVLDVESKEQMLRYVMVLNGLKKLPQETGINGHDTKEPVLTINE